MYQLRFPYSSGQQSSPCSGSRSAFAVVPEPWLPWQSHVGMHLHCKLVWLYGQTCGYRGQQAQERPCWCVWPIHQQRGNAQTPTALPLGKEGIALREMDRESSCSFSQCRWAGWQGTALHPHPVEMECCILEQPLWNLPAHAGLVVGLSSCEDISQSKPQAWPHGQKHIISFAMLWWEGIQGIDRSWELSKGLTNNIKTWQTVLFLQDTEHYLFLFIFAVFLYVPFLFTHN